jgi:hypothetical protein
MKVLLNVLTYFEKCAAVLTAKYILIVVQRWSLFRSAK